MQMNGGGAAYWEFFPLSDVSGTQTRTHTLDVMRAATQTALFYDGVEVHSGNWNRLSLRHGGESSLNILYGDGHAASVTEDGIPAPGTGIGGPTANTDGGLDAFLPTLWRMNSPK